MSEPEIVDIEHEVIKVRHTSYGECMFSLYMYEYVTTTYSVPTSRPNTPYEIHLINFKMLSTPIIAQKKAIPQFVS